jgi:hypothetical protein
MDYKDLVASPHDSWPSCLTFHCLGPGGPVHGLQGPWWRVLRIPEPLLLTSHCLGSGGPAHGLQGPGGESSGFLGHHCSILPPLAARGSPP